MDKVLSYKSLISNKNVLFYLIAEFLSAFNDNVYQMFLSFYVVNKCISSGYIESSGAYLSLVHIIFILPYLLFSGYAAYFSDKYKKQFMFRQTKFAEAIIFFFAAVAIWCDSLFMMLVMLFFAMTKSCFFYPAKIGIIPDLVPKSAISLTNGLVQMSVFVAILLGAAFAGYLSSYHSNGFIGLVLIFFGIIGSISSLQININESEPDDIKFPSNPWGEILSGYKRIFRSQALTLTVIGESWFWFMGSLLKLCIILYAKKLLEIGDTSTALLTGFLAIGIACGSLVSGNLSKRAIELGLIPFGSFGLAITSFYLAFSSPSYLHASVSMLLIGFFGGLYIVPVVSFLQARIKQNERGKLLTTSNFTSTVATILAPVLFWILNSYLGFGPEKILLIFAIMTAIVTAYTLYTVPVFFIKFIWIILSRIMYRIKNVGGENIPEKGGCLLVANHASYLDGPIVLSCLQRNVRFMIYHKYFKYPPFSWVFKLMGFIPVYDGKRIKESLEIAKMYLETGSIVCIFAEGEITRTGNMLPFRRGLEKIIKDLDNVPIVPVHIHGAWGTIFSFEREKFFFKWPKKFPYYMTVSFGKQLNSDTSAFEVREEIMNLGSEVNSSESKFTLPIHFIRTAKRSPLKMCLVDSQSKSLSYRSVLFRVINLAWHLKSYGKGIGTWTYPCRDSAILHIALSFAGVTANPIRKQDKSDFVITQKGFLKNLDNHPSNPIFLEDIIDKKAPFFVSIAACIFPASFFMKYIMRSGYNPKDEVVKLNTDSGCATLSNENIVNHLQSISQIIFIYPKDRMLSTVEYSESLGYVCNLWFPMLMGIGMIYNKSKKSSDVERLAKQYKVSVIFENSEFYENILEKLEIPNLRCAISITDSTNYISTKEVHDFQIYEGFGSPYMTCFISLNHKGYKDEKINQIGVKEGSFGQCMPGIVIKVVGEDGSSLKPNEVGKILVKSSSFASSNIGAETQDGWYVIQHKGYLDEGGFIHFIEKFIEK
jgi:acyl-[acyl-carrier-protein]-phospholipid O-acyltransferase / long-chain-fatty-acid--[acyl-carrier-protein] ligase